MSASVLAPDLAQQPGAPCATWLSTFTAVEAPWLLGQWGSLCAKEMDEESSSQPGQPHDGYETEHQQQTQFVREQELLVGLWQDLG